MHFADVAAPPNNHAPFGEHHRKEIMKEKLLLSQKYKRGALIAAHKTSRSMDHLPHDFLIREIELREAGIVERGGKEYEFQTIRLLLEKVG